MINLLPTDTRRDTLYARRNSRMLRWLLALSVALVVSGLIIGAGYVYLNQSTKDYQKRLEVSKQNLQAQNVEQTQKKVEEISGNIKLTTQVLGKEILFSKLLRQFGATLPANTSLDQLQIDKLQGGLTLSVLAKDINSATQVQVNLQDPKNKIFEKADIENISCDPGGTNKSYPCTVQIKALFLKDNPFLYIAPNAAKAAQP